MIKNTIGGTLEELTLAEFVSKFEGHAVELIELKLEDVTIEGAVLFENLQMDSSNFGTRTAWFFGHGLQNPTVEACATKVLGKTPGTFQYPIAYFKK